jgi:hypothetical protein
MELLGKLAALVLPLRVHLVRYHGVVATHARRRRANEILCPPWMTLFSLESQERILREIQSSIIIEIPEVELLELLP